MADLASNLFILNGIIAAILATSNLTAPEANKPTLITQPVTSTTYQRTAADEAAYEALVAKLAATPMPATKLKD